MKKSKVIIPALGVLILSTAASVTGTVAWFTANRTATITAGEFAVVKTGDTLEVSLGAGIGTSVDGTAVSVSTGNKLTDASFDHTAYSGTILPIVTPDVPREKVLSNIALSAATSVNMLRATNTFSAFTWTMTFTVAFSESASKDQGLFIDLNDSATYMHEKVTPENGTDVSSGYYTNPACTTPAAGEANGTTPYYKTAPDHTGKAFRIAFVPTTVPANSLGITKVWADNEGSADNEGQFVDGVAEGAALAATSYGTVTTSLTNGTYASISAGSGKVLMRSGDNSTIPADDTVAKSGALSGNSNYLGYFHANPGNSVAMTFTCVAWYDGTHPEIVGSATDFETIVASMKFGVSNLTD